MARIGISITKSVSFRNVNQEFSNVYYYDGLASLPDETQANTLIDELVTKEKTIHGTAVTFVRGRLWSQGGSPGSNNMISQKNLSGTGSLTSNSSMDRERAYLYRLRAGNDSRGNPVYLRKWYHACADVGGVSVSTAILANTTGFTVANRTALVAALPAIGGIGSGGLQGVLTSKAGRNTTAGALWEAHPFLEHHQLGDMWRAQ